MKKEMGFAEKIALLKQKVAALDDVSDQMIIEQTAKRLEGVNYAPPVTVPVTDFVRMTKDSLLLELDKILALPDSEACALAPNETKKWQDLRVQFISVLIYYYKKLLLLRQDDGESWDDIDELYVHD